MAQQQDTRWLRKLRGLKKLWKALWEFEREISVRSFREAWPTLREFIVVPVILLLISAIGGLLIGKVADGYAGTVAGLALFLVSLLAWSRTAIAAQVYMQQVIELKETQSTVAKAEDEAERDTREIEQDTYEAKEIATIDEFSQEVRRLITSFREIPERAAPPGRAWQRYESLLDRCLEERAELPKATGTEYRNIFKDLQKKYTMRLPAQDHREAIGILELSIERDCRRRQTLLENRSARLTELRTRKLLRGKSSLDPPTAKSGL